MAYFKYIAFERFEGLRRRRIRFTQPGAFNDPFEMPAFKAAEAEAVRRTGLAGLTEQTGDIMGGLTEGRIPQAAFVPPIFYWFGHSPLAPRPRSKPSIPSETAIEKIRRIDEVFGILSLSMTADNLLLWAHYASEHRGLAVEIDPADAEFNRHAGAGIQFQLARPVKYSAERPQIPETDEILFEHFFTKSVEWSYEREYRIVRKLSSSVDTTDESAAFPVHLYVLPPSAICRVIFGARVPDDRRSALIGETKSDPALSHVRFAESVLDPAGFRVGIHDLDENAVIVLSRFRREKRKSSRGHRDRRQRK